MTTERAKNRRFAIGVARGFGGALFFSLPLLMTMEMWWLGFYIDRFRLALLIAAMLPLLIVLIRYSGFADEASWLDDTLDAFVAYGIGAVTAAVILVLQGVLETGMPASEIIGKIALQAAPASFGAALATSQFGASDDDGEEKVDEEGGYGAELIFMIAGALFLAFNLAPTEEMVLIAYRMTRLHAVLLLLLSLGVMHAFVYAVEFRGSHAREDDVPWWSIFLRFTVVGYAIALLISAYVLWTFGRFDGSAFTMCLLYTVVLAFPASLGASAARLIL